MGRRQPRPRKDKDKVYVSEEKNVQELLRQGIEAAREGNKAEARKFFEQVVELDDKNEKGWFWLASVVETDEEKKVCLGNVLFINPNNERAQKAMEQLQSKDKKRQQEEEVIPGITRRQLTLFVGGGAAIIVAILLIFLLVSGSRNAQIASQTAEAQAAIAQLTQIVVDINSTATSAVETAVALASPTPTLTNTPDRATLPPTFTLQPSATLAVTQTPLPPPSGVSGTLFAWSGRDTSQNGFLPIFAYSLGNGQANPITGNQARNLDLSGDGQRLIYTRFFATTQDYGLGSINISGTDEQTVAQGLSIIKPQMPSYCKTSNVITFVALPIDQREIQFGAGETVELPFQLFTLDLDTNTLTRLTNDKAGYTYPTFSPSCSQIAVVHNDAGGTNPGSDIVIVDVATLTQTAVTNDLKNFTESDVHWSPDGTKLIYSAESINEPGNGDIIIRPADGSGTPLLPIPDETNANDVYPVFSPDGKYIAFSSNRSGFYDIYVFDQTSSVLYQLTSSEDEDYPGAWGQ
jgi:Tol biopolymer transport system component